MKLACVRQGLLFLLASGLLLGLPACSPRQEASRWQAVQIPTDADFTGLWFADSLNGWLAGGGWAISGGIVGRTSDGGRTWRFDSGVIPGGGEREAFGRVRFLDARRGCAAASNASILVTSDAGETWRRVRGPGGGILFDVRFLEGSSTGWAAGTELVRTDDGGETWRVLHRTTDDTGYILANAIHFVDTTRGWLVGHVAQVLRTDDGGFHWTAVPMPLKDDKRPILRDVTFADDMHGWIVGEEGTILHTADGGDTWERQENGVPIVRVRPRGEPPRPREILPELEVEPDRLALAAVAFADANRGWTVGYYSDVAESVVLRTDDGGATWKVEHVQPGELLRSLFVLDTEHAWAAGDRARTTSQVLLRRGP